MTRVTLLATCLALPLLAGPAFADEGLCRTGITAEEAIRIARDAGVARVQEVDCDDGRWEVEGRDAQGRKIEVDVHARDGRVIEVDRERR
ncbi:PepSY domain-containing protein [Roseomonas terrae]|uniref:PepSY domain-containing protein n=1 Tax=Neoroseomonas terrae TaxID=424799 RepID=A0ABS5EE75_9PROT|nr:PepSY domain-containing protein [Neoroseomonas terrae]MBR0649316.1 PepSY domain-containing protein [Neoroseomonas terrae]